MDLKIFHDTVRYFLNREQGGWLSPEEIDNITDRAQMWFFSQCLEIYGKDQKAQDYLSTFSTKLTFTSSSTGIVTFPTDQAVSPCYQNLLSIYVKYVDAQGRTRTKPIKIVSEDEIAERLDSQILAPSITDPAGTEFAKGQVQLYPETYISGVAHYLRRPKRPVFAYGQTGRTISYVVENSTQLEWSEGCINQLLIKTIQMFGVNIADELIIQYSETKNQQDI